MQRHACLPAACREPQLLKCCFAPLQVLLRFSTRFHDTFVPGRKYNVRFSIKRTSFVFMHEALDVAQRGVMAGSRPELLLPPATATPVAGNGHKVRLDVFT